MHLTSVETNFSGQISYTEYFLSQTLEFVSNNNFLFILYVILLSSSTVLWRSLYLLNNRTCYNRMCVSIIIRFKVILIFYLIIGNNLKIPEFYVSAICGILINNQVTLVVWIENCSEISYQFMLHLILRGILNYFYFTSEKCIWRFASSSKITNYVTVLYGVLTESLIELLVLILPSFKFRACFNSISFLYLN